MSLTKRHRELCTRCGLCLTVCPMYHDHTTLLDEVCDYLEDRCEEVVSHDIFRCLTCGLCIEACPQNLSIKKLINTARVKWVTSHGVRKEHSIVNPLSNSNLFRVIAVISEPPLLPDGAAAENETDAEKATAMGGRDGAAGGSVVYYPGCAATYINTSIAAATITILESAGISYSVMSGLSYCCGAVSAGSGNKQLVEEMGKKNVAEIRKRDADTLITSCPGCFRAFHDMYPRLFSEMDFEVLHISQYLDRLINEKIIVPERLEHRVFYQDPCHLTRSVGMHKEPRAVLSSIPGTRLLNESPEGSICCGFGGSVRAAYPTESLGIAVQCHETAKDMGCDVIVTNCPGCMQNIVEVGMMGGRDGDDDNALMVYDLGEYVSMALGNTIERDDMKMIKDVNTAYGITIAGYCRPSWID